MDRTFGVLGAVSGAIAVGAGAFGAHALRARVAPAMLDVFETAARYQMYHALALLVVALLLDRRPGTAPRAAGWCFVAGTLLFCGSLYGMALTGARTLGAITPVGGLCFLAGWGALAMTVGRRPAREAS